MWAITLPTRIKKAFRSIRFKFILAYLLIIILAFAVIGMVTIQLVGENLFRQTCDNAVKNLNTAGVAVGKALKEGDYLSAYSLCLEYGEAQKARLIALDENRRVACDTLSVLNGREFDIPAGGEIKHHDAYASPRASSSESFFGLWPEYLTQAALLRAERYPELKNGFSAERLIAVSVPLSSGGALVAVLDADAIRDAQKDDLIKLLTVLIALFAACLLLGFLITRSYTRPVKELSAAISKLSEGDFSVRVNEKGNNELSDLSRAFNEMTGRMEMLDRSRNQFVSNASHELKTPLATIKIMVQTLLYQEVYDESMSKEFLTDVDKETDRLNAVVSDLLTLVGMDSGETKLKQEELSLSAMLRDDVKRLSPLARERGVELEINAPQSLDIVGDRIKLDQVFYNLIDNAIKYTPRGEGVLVELTRQNRNAVVRVKDNGIGIPEADIKHIFDRFYRVDKARSRETGGTGLGLSIVKQIILAHGGTINVTSKVDEGSVFTVTLPLTRSAGGQG